MFAHRPCYSQLFEKPDGANLLDHLNSMTTNGLEVKATLVTLVPKAEGGNGGTKNSDNQPLSEGTPALVKKNLDGVTGVLDLCVHRQGVFQKSKEQDADALDHIGIGVDPGRIEVFARLQTWMIGVNPEEKYSQRDLMQIQFTSSGKRYNALSLRANSKRHEERRRRSNKR